MRGVVGVSLGQRLIGRAFCEGLFDDVVAACDPSRRVRDALVRAPIEGELYGVAIGKAALAMARGAGPVVRGVCVTNADDGRELPAGWSVMVSAHPEPDERSLAAGDGVLDLVASVPAADHLLVLVSGGASALVERPVPGLTLERLRAEIRAMIECGAPIHEINRARVELSSIKGGKLAALAEAPITTLVISDVFDDDLATIGSGPTFPPRARQADRIELVAPMRLAAEQAYEVLSYKAKIEIIGPLVGTVEDSARRLIAVATVPQREITLGWGEPTIRIPTEHGVGGRAQQLALGLARELRRGERSAFVIGTDGIDGQRPIARPMPAGAYVDGATWDAIIGAGIDPQAALARCDAGTALDAVGALVVTGPTGINHGDLVIVG